METNKNTAEPKPGRRKKCHISVTMTKYQSHSDVTVQVNTDNWEKSQSVEIEEFYVCNLCLNTDFTDPLDQGQFA